jgi:demethylmenaquinone methyltransferase/2-methoxy-6-polyprenyl-1,4-benzoquinol methylase
VSADVASYVYMKILESRPERYDRGIALLSLGAADRCKRRLVEDNVAPESRVLEIGTGTGTMAVLAAERGAHVLAFDISAAMLDVAQKKVDAAEVADRVELREMGVSGMDELLDASFDLVMSTLVFSELSPDEQRYALHHAHRVLDAGGRLAIADEARPRSLGRRVLHGAVRVPLAVVTFVLTQTSTSAVQGLSARVSEAGFAVEREDRSALDSFVYLIATKGPAR